MVITNVNQVVYQGDGVTTAFPFTFRIIDATDIKLLLLDSDGTETDILSDFFVDTENDTVHYPGYAPGAEPALSDRPPVLAEGQKLVIYRKLPITQEKDLGDKWPFYVIELGLDKLTMILQDIWDWLGRCLYVSKGQAYEAGDDFDPTIPLEAGKVICGNADGTGFEAREAMMEVNGAWDGEGRQIKGLANPTDEQDAVTGRYMKDHAISLDGTSWDAKNYPIKNVGGPVQTYDAATKDYVDKILEGYSGQGERFTMFDNVAQMREADLIPSQMVATMGYYNPNDGGHGAYVIRAKLVSDVDDGGSIIILDNDNVAQLLTDGTVNVRQFGAVGNANYTNYDDAKLYESVSLDFATVAAYYNASNKKWYASATFEDEGVYYNTTDEKHYYSTDATEAPYLDNVNDKWYVSAVFTTEGIYEYDGVHYASYDPDTDTYSDEAPYYDNVGDKWYVTAVYTDEGVYYYNDKHWVLTTSTEAPYYDNVNEKWYVSATYADVANACVNDVWYHGAIFSTESADDSVAITNAVNFGNNVMFAPGKYCCSQINVGSYTHIIGYNAELYKKAAGSGPILNIVDVDHVFISGLVLDGRSEAIGGLQYSDRHNIYLVGSSNIVIENVVSKYAGCDCIYVADNYSEGIKAHDIILNNCQFLYGFRQGMSVISCDGLLAENCHFSYTGRSSAGGYPPRAGVDLESNHGDEYPQNITFINCKFEHNIGAGLECKNSASRNVKVSGCTVNDNYGYGIYCCPASVTTIENTIITNHALSGNVRAAIFTDGSNAIVKISNVLIQDSVAAAIDCKCKFALVDNVVISNCGYTGLHLYGNAVVKNVGIYDTYLGNIGSVSYKAAIVIDGHNISLENIKIANDEDMANPARYAITVRGTYKNVNIKNMSINGPFRSTFYSLGRVSSIEGLEVNDVLGYYRTTGNRGSSFFNNSYAKSGTAAPTSGTWSKGDKVYNSSPAAGGYEGWVCVTGGTPGTWKGFGQIQS